MIKLAMFFGYKIRLTMNILLYWLNISHNNFYSMNPFCLYVLQDIHFFISSCSFFNHLLATTLVILKMSFYFQYTFINGKSTMVSSLSFQLRYKPRPLHLLILLSLCPIIGKIIVFLTKDPQAFQKQN